MHKVRQKIDDIFGLCTGIDTPPYRPPHDPDREPRQQSQVWSADCNI